MTNQEQAQSSYLKDLAARSPKAGRSTDRVFIADAYNHMVSCGEDEGMSLAEFKALCLSLAHKGGIILTRCDLVGAFELTKVEQSSCMRMGAEFHFIAV